MRPWAAAFPISAALGAALVVIFSSGVEAWSNYEGPFGSDGHPTITTRALPFLWSDLVDELIARNSAQDDGDRLEPPGDDNPTADNRRHFVNCLFSDSATYINDRYRDVLDALNPAGGGPRTARALQSWGQLLHTSQDFYSHTVWADPEGLRAGNRILESSLAEWNLPKPYKPIFDDVVIVQGNPPQAVTIDLRRDGSGKPISAVPIVQKTFYSHSLDGYSVAFKRHYRGLMTASSYPFQNQMKCPPAERLICTLQQETSDPPSPHFCCRDAKSVCIRHGEDECGRKFHEDCLHHDDKSRPNRPLAFPVAVRQTEHEWCRLLHLVAAADGPDTGSTAGTRASVLMALWTSTNGAPHPAGTPCAPETASQPHKISVRLRGVSVSKELTRWRYSFAIYKTNFKDSRRMTFTTQNQDVLIGPLELCVNDNDAIVAALWAHDNDEDFDKDTAVLGGVQSTKPVASLVDGQNTPTGLIGDADVKANFEFRFDHSGCQR